MKQQKTKDSGSEVFIKVKNDLEHCIKLLNSDIEALMNEDNTDAHIWFGMRELREGAMDILEYLNGKIR